MEKMKPSKKNLESLESPKYLQVSKNLITSVENSKKDEYRRQRIISPLRWNLSKESPFNFDQVQEFSLEKSKMNKKSAYNELKDNQEFKIGEDPKARNAFVIKTRFPPLEVYK